MNLSPFLFLNSFHQSIIVHESRKTLPIKLQSEKEPIQTLDSHVSSDRKRNIEPFACSISRYYRWRNRGK